MRKYLKLVQIMPVILLGVSRFTGIAEASDGKNLCSASVNHGSRHVKLPEDDSNHFPDQWRGPKEKINAFSKSDALETTYKFEHWAATPKSGGAPVRFDALRIYTSVFGPSPFANGQLGWIRTLMVTLLGPDGQNHVYKFIAPGEFTPRQNGYDFAVGGPNENMVLGISQSGSVAPVANPKAVIAHSIGSGGSGMVDDVVTPDGLIEWHARDESIKRANFPAKDGFDPRFGYYWARPWLKSTGTLTYNHVEYSVTGDGWEERQWKLGMADISAHAQWTWLSAQIHGCLDAAGNKTNNCQHTLTTLAAWTNADKVDGHLLNHYYNEVLAPPRCEGHDLAKPGDWSITPMEFAVSPLTGIRYATKVHLVVPSRKVDIYATQKIAGAEVNEGIAEGVAEIAGTMDGETVYGIGMLEQLGAVKDKK